MVFCKGKVWRVRQFLIFFLHIFCLLQGDAVR